MNEVRIDNWVVVNRGNDTYTAPELQTTQLQGTVTGHPRFHDGESIITSSVVAVIRTNDGGFLIVSHSGTHYRLGQAHPDYEKAYPNAFERLMTSLEKFIPKGNETI